ncbi:histidine phosphatase family protein [Paraburkholderia phosphatilytica]|uniref:histidine phosphatase family protein n=1 Tax=Paraburkholderia phosphatilytica TaxID=2282883 RepID=UPI000E531973|nr:histidine phosphatase family protein [Paraburkholderia phosphatilytica]
MDFILIRHPRVAIGEGVCYGSSDVALSEDAPRSAAQIAARLSALGVPAPARLVCSPLSRCTAVADALVEKSFSSIGAPQPYAALAEMDFGAWEQQRWDSIERTQLDAWAADFEYARPHGGESVAQFTERVQRWFLECVDDLPDRDGPVYAVTHAGVIRAIASMTLDVPLELCLRWSLNLPAIVWLTRRESEPAQAGSWTLRCWNA